MTTDPAGATGEPTDPDGDPEMLASKNPEASPATGAPVDGVAAATPVQEDPDDQDDADADPDMLGSGS